MTATSYTFATSITKPVRLDYLLYTPDDYTESERWPLILFLHGSGECGADVAAVRRHGLPAMLDDDLELPCFVLAPQCPAHTIWSLYLDALVALLDSVTAQYAIDTDRVYVTGLSMGGMGAWHLVATYPERFAALVPVCGSQYWMAGDPAQETASLHTMPIWVFHGVQDDVIPVEASRLLVRGLRTHNDNVRFTEYQDVGHASWQFAYAKPELYEWLLGQCRVEPEYPSEVGE